MSQNRTTIINTALMRVGAQGVNFAFQDTPVAQVAEAAYDRSLEFCLSLYPWPFALRYAVLAQSADAPPFGYRYAYHLPGDCMRVLDVRRHGDAGDIPSWAYRHPGPRYSIVGQEIYTDADSLALRYVSNDGKWLSAKHLLMPLRGKSPLRFLSTFLRALPMRRTIFSFSSSPLTGRKLKPTRRKIRCARNGLPVFLRNGG